jgi:Cu/Ag efflux protein CusF
MIFLRPVVAALSAAALLAGAPLVASAQAPAPVIQTATASKTGTITSIDYTQRVVTLQFPDGTVATITATPTITRFAELKVGDKVTFAETATIVYSIVKPGATAPPAETSSAATPPGAKPGGTQSTTKTTTADGRTLSFLVKSPANIAGLKVGDSVLITYTDMVKITVE